MVSPYGKNYFTTYVKHDVYWIDILIYFQGLNKEFENAYQYRERTNLSKFSSFIKKTAGQNEHNDMKNGTTKINNPKIIVENSAFVVEDHILRHHREEVHLLLVRPLVHPSTVQGVGECHLG